MSIIPPHWSKATDGDHVGCWVRKDGYVFEPLPNRYGWRLVVGERRGAVREYYSSIVVATSDVDKAHPFKDDPSSSERHGQTTG